MPIPILADGTALGIGIESTWGTAVSRTIWLPINSTSVEKTVQKRPRPTLNEGANIVRRKHYTEQIAVTGSIELPASYEGMGAWWKALLGAAATAGSGSPYTHTYSLDGDQPSLTLEVILGDSGDSDVFEGCKVSKGSLKVAAGRLVSAVFDVIGETSTRGSAGTPSWADSRDLVIDQAECGTISVGSSTATVKSMEVAVDRKLSSRYLVGSLYTAEPAPGDFCDITLKVEMEWLNDDFYTALHSDTAGDVTFTFTSGARSLQVAIDNAYVESASAPINSAGIISQSVMIRAQAGTNGGIRLIAINTQSSAVGA